MQGEAEIAREKKMLSPRSIPIRPTVQLITLIALGVFAFTLTMTGLARWPVLWFAIMIGGVLFLITLYWLVHMRRLAKTLLEERNLLRTLIDTLPDRIYFKDSQGRKIICNIADWQASGGKRMEDVIGKTDFDTYPPELAVNYWADDRTVIDSGEAIINREEPALDPQGKLAWMLTTKMPVRDGHGKLRGIVGISRDTTTFKLASEALRNAQEHYKKIFEGSVEGIYQSDIDGKIITINSALARMLGYTSPAELIASTKYLCQQFYVDPSRRAEFKLHLENTSIITNFESEVYRKDDSKFWVSENGRVVRDENGTVLYYEGTVVDITERKRAEDARHKAEEKYRSFFENSLEGIFQTTADGKFIVANPALAKILGYDCPEDLVTSVTELDQELYVDSTHRADLKKRLEEEGRVSGFESEVFRKDGSTMWIVENAQAVRGEDGKLLYYEGTLVDITARKQIEQTQQEAHRKQVAWISELERRTREISLLNEMIDLIQCCPTVEEAYSVISRQAEGIFPQESGALYILSPSRNLAESMATWGAPLNDQPAFNPADCWAFRRGQLHVVERDAATDHGNNLPLLFCAHLQSPMPAACICIPLIAQGETLGVLHLRPRTERGSNISETPEVWYTEARRQLAHTVADSLALAISNLKLRESLRQQSIRDPLTGMFNRRYMEESLEREIARAARAGHGLGVIMLDVDHFKDFNDMFGHEAGDAVLRELGVFFRSQIRESDIGCRYGGEEFALIMPDAGLDITRQRAEKIRMEIKGLQVRHHERLLGSLTFSLGVAAFPGHGATGDVLLRIADAALYRAKRSGRDRVVIGTHPKDQRKTSDR